MTMINDVKKVFRDTGAEMDADDIVAELVERSVRYRGRLTRGQVSGCLARLCSSDVDIDRTRPGLYQYRRATPQVDHGRPAVTGQTPSQRPSRTMCPRRSLTPRPTSVRRSCSRSVRFEQVTRSAPPTWTASATSTRRSTAGLSKCQRPRQQPYPSPPGPAGRAGVRRSVDQLRQRPGPRHCDGPRRPACPGPTGAGSTRR
jgi:hypothetical protein